MTDLIDATLFREFHDTERPYVALRFPSREEIARVVHEVRCGCPIDDESLAAHREHQLDPIQYPHFSQLVDAVLALLRRTAQTPTELDSRLTGARERETAHHRVFESTPAWWGELADIRHEIALIFGTAAAILPASSLAGRAAMDACMSWHDKAQEARSRAGNLEPNTGHADGPTTSQA